MACLRPISAESGKSLGDGKGQQKSIIEIYTDWANHYLDKTKGKRRITNLQTELSDGVVLCEVIEAVTQQKVPDVNKKPKNNAIVITNIQACLNFLRGKGVTVDEIKPEDIRDGNLKSILGLFFQLSRYKQQQKQQLGMGRTSIPSSPAKTSSIPVPGAAMSPKRVVGGEHKQETRSMIPGSKIANGYGSGIARPGGVCAQDKTGHDGERAEIKPPSGRHGKVNGHMANGNSHHTRQDGTKQSMLDRFKIGRTNTSNLPTKPGLGKRTSSSSGFSSARSDRSESSISLSSDTNFPSPSALRRIQEAQESIPATEQQHHANGSRRAGTGIRSRFSPAAKDKSCSPKRSPRLGRHAAASAVTEIKDYGPIDEGGSSRLGGKPEKYPPHAYSRSNSGIAFKHTNISSTANGGGGINGRGGSGIGGGGVHGRGSLGGAPVSASKVPTPAAAGAAASASKIGKVDRGAAAATSGLGKKQPPAPPQRTNSIPHQELSKTSLQDPKAENCNLPGSVSTSITTQENAKCDPDTASVCSTQSAASTACSAKGGCSLPRQAASRTLSPSPNVAVVSPMPSTNRCRAADSASPSPAAQMKKDARPTADGINLEEGMKKLPKDDLRRQRMEAGDLSGGVVPPMAPLELFRTRKVGVGAEKQNTDDHHSLIMGDAGYVSDSDVIRNRSKIDSGYVSEGGADFLRRGVRSKTEDGYTSEGGADFYSRRAEQRLAYEKQRAEAENQHKLYLELTGKAGNDAAAVTEVNGRGTEQVYKVVGGRRNVPKSDSGIQTEIRSKSRTSSGDVDGKVILPGRMEKEDLSKAMERSRMLLTSQELAMQEYLKRQKREADKHIRNSPLSSRRNNGSSNMNTVPGRNGGMMSMPGTPTGYRRNNNMMGGDAGGRYARGGSLERKISLPPDAGGRTNTSAASHYSTVSDSEYGTYNTKSNKENSRSLPKGTSSLNYGLLVGQIQQKRQQKARKDGNWSDTNYSTYTEIMSQKIGGGGAAKQQTHYGWLQPAQTYSGWSASATAAGSTSMAGHTTADTRGSNESLNSISSSIRNARSLSLTRANVMAHQMKTEEKFSKLGSPHGLSRYGNSEDTEYYGVPILTSTPAGSTFNSQPTSPVYGDRSLALDLGGTIYAASSSTTPRYSSLPPNIGGKQLKQHAKTNSFGSKDNLSGSHLSLASNDSSVYGTQEEKTNADIAKLKRELAEEQSKVFCLTNQLNTNAHVVSAFEQSLANMTSRLHEITRTAEKKDCELSELRRTIDVLRQSGVDAGLIKASKEDSPASSSASGYDLTRQMSTDSVTSLGDEDRDGSKKSTGPKRSGWLRSSFSKAFSKSKAKGKSTPTSDQDDTPGSRDEPTSLGHIPTNSEDLGNLKPSKSSSDLSQEPPAEADKMVDELKRQLIEKDSLLTETRLEALSSAHQLESLKDTVTKMKSELINLRQDNEKLQTQVAHKSLGSSESSLNTTAAQDSEVGGTVGGERRVSVAVSEGSMISGPSTLDLSGTTDPSNQENKHLSVEVELSESEANNMVRIGTIAASCKLSWQLLDSLIERLFKEYIMRIDSVTHLGLGADSILYYRVGEINRKVKDVNPELLPYGYLVGDVDSISIVLKNTSTASGGLDAFALETLTPKSIVQRYISMLQDHRRVILSGPSGSTGKTYMALKLAKLLMSLNAKEAETLKMEHFELSKTNHEDFVDLIQRVNVDAERMPFVMILDNLHLASNVDLILSQNLAVGPEAGPFIIGTMIQSSSNNSTNLQLKHNFRWILCANHIEPVRGLLSRFLKKKLLTLEAETRQFNPELAKIVDWVSKVLLSINKFLETHCNPESTLSPTTFMSCPMDAHEAKLWFLNLWNLTIVPHTLDAVTEGLQAFGRRGAWEDPLHALQESWPWAHHDLAELVRIRPEDVAFESYPLARPVSGHSGDNCLDDPLFNMLMTLQEAATNQTSPDL